MISIRARMFNFFVRLFIRSAWKAGEYDIGDIRHRVGLLDRLFRVIPRKTTVTPVSEINGEWVVADSVTGDGVLLYLHGGGFSVHLPRLYRKFAADLSRRLNVRVLIPDYRLAPESPFPAAPQDCLAAYRWLLNQPGVNPDRLWIAGDSAGGNLALVTLQQARDEGLPLPVAGWIISPGVDCDWSHSDLTRLQQIDPMFSVQALTLMDPYFNGADRKDFRISPVNGDLRGLPPLLIEAGDKEMFREHPAIYGEAAREVGSEVTDRTWPHMPHVFQLFGFLPEAKRARERAAKFLSMQGC